MTGLTGAQKRRYCGDVSLICLHKIRSECTYLELEPHIVRQFATQQNGQSLRIVHSLGGEIE